MVFDLSTRKNTNCLQFAPAGSLGGVSEANTSCGRPLPQSLLLTWTGSLEDSPTLRRTPEFASFSTFLFESLDVGSQFWQVSVYLQMFACLTCPSK